MRAKKLANGGRSSMRSNGGRDFRSEKGFKRDKSCKSLFLKRQKKATTPCTANDGGGPGRSGGAACLTVETEPYQIAASPRIVEICLRFGVPLILPARSIARNLKVNLAPGTLTLITGPSGAGKSLLLAEIGRQIPTSRHVGRLPFPLDVSVLDGVSPTRDVYEALSILTTCGLGEPMLWIRKFDSLSDGEQFRAKLARAISLQQRARIRSPLLVDEFAAILHRRIAKAIAFNLRKLVTQQRISLVVATSHDDLERDLQPDTIIRLGNEQPVVETADTKASKRVHRRRAPSFAGRLHIERGSLRDYRHFGAMHYRQRDNLGFIDRVFVMREGTARTPLGIVIYGRPVLELTLRNRATGGRFVRNGKRLNRELRVLKRLVIHPDVRGCGLGHWLVKRTLPLAGTRFVECLAAMGAINPVFDRAGMRRIGVVQPPASLSRAVARIQKAGVDPVGADFVWHVCRRPSIRRIVADTVFDWYRATTGGGEQRVEKQTSSALARTFRQLAGSQPVYFLWARDARTWAIIDKNAPTEPEM